MDLRPLVTSPRLWVPALLFAAFLFWEWLRPFRISARSKLEHDSTNFVLFGANSLIASTIAGWAVVLQYERWDIRGWGILPQFHIGGLSRIVLTLVLLDLTLYGFHWSSHRIPFLWRFHRIHHSDLDVDVTTSIRFHFGEVLIASGFRALAASLIGASRAGFLIYETVFLAASQFQHSNIRLQSGLERWIRFAVVTPHMHRVHHSRRPSEHHSNFGVMISVWDRLFGTYVRNIGQSNIQFGLNRYSRPEDVELLRLIRIPLDPA